MRQSVPHGEIMLSIGLKNIDVFCCKTVLYHFPSHVFFRYLAMFLAVYITVDNLKLKVMVMSSVSGLTEMANMQTRITFSFSL